MAFHVACPLTCRRICDCELGFPAGLRGGTEREEFLQQIARVEDFIRSPWMVRPPAPARAGGGTVRVLVPRVAPLPLLAQAVGPANAQDAGERDQVVFSSVEGRRAALQRQALATSMATEDYVRRLEAGRSVEVPGETTGDLAREDQVSLNAKVICRICFSGNEGSEHARKMLSCKHCKKKYHKSCLKVWAENRDLFHWSSWVCPSCRICEQCSGTGDPTKLMFCKRCDAAYHCYCQHPPHKNVTHGPYLCPKHTRCHSCGSTVPGNGPSTRWFLGYTCCDACGRLFVKGNYCPVCLKVYRDSESTPMVCCDVCQQWVHCVCDEISDEKYQQFQADGNLYYKCAACRGDCHQVKDVDDAVRELWKRIDKADNDLIIRLKVAAGLPSHEEIRSVSPSSDDEETSGPVLVKNYHGRTLNFAVKGLMNKSTSTNENVKIVTVNLSSPKKHTKKGYQVSSYQKFDDQHEAEAIESDLKNLRTGGAKLYSTDMPQTSLLIKNREAEEGIHNCQVGNSNHFLTKQPMTPKIKKVSKVKIKGGKSHSPGMHIKDDDGINTNKGDGMRGTKLVIHLGAKNRNSASSPKSDASSCHREQDSAVCTAKTYESGNTSIDVASEVEERAEKVHTNDEPLPKMDRSLRVKDDAKPLQSSRDDPKPLLKLKFKNPYIEQQSSWSRSGMEEMNSIKGQRSKRKRPTSQEKVGPWNGEISEKLPDIDAIDEAIDANWILQKLGKDAVGKRVEVHEPSNNSWCKGMVQDVLDGTTSLVVRLDDGRPRTLELRQQRVRFISKKQKRTRTWHQIQKL